MSTATAPAAASLRPSNKKLIFFCAFFVITAFVTYMKNAQVLNAASEMAKHYAPATLFLIPHAFFAGIAYVLGAFQFSSRLRAKYVKVHRVLGYIYIVCAFIAAPLAIPLSARIDGPSLTAASLMQAFGWMACIAIALYAIRTGNIQQHRRWMVRGYAFASVFTVARMIIPIPFFAHMGLTGIEIVVWMTIAMAAFLPTIFLDWQTLAPKRVNVAKAAAGAVGR